MQLKNCRKVVREFAIQMEVILRENDHKSGWKDMGDNEIIARILDETSEALTAENEGMSPCKEAIDIANFAMMLWDNIRSRENHR